VYPSDWPAIVAVGSRQAMAGAPAVVDGRHAKALPPACSNATPRAATNQNLQNPYRRAARVGPDSQGS